MSLSACLGVENRSPSEKKLQIPGSMPQGGVVTGRIETVASCASSQAWYMGSYIIAAKPLIRRLREVELSGAHGGLVNEIWQRRTNATFRTQLKYRARGKGSLSLPNSHRR